ncbi:5-formyltetrahydrofolate cyclo-ligase [Aneurinibacillus tyrosinisolvens]|uniref:5-formyltetrahydrofolate cyclo-ligase n=1 Tax=Aneurinibacillus tyrosinisolvens TaxID=1443435 RepID=UPI00063F499B|nr:5-formyltetrahydrofolate cyclo-ligase [Aneurinibacillus tyrosinisolvens]
MEELIAEQKKQIRKQILAMRGAAELEERAKWSRTVAEKLLSLPEIQEARLLFSFLSFGDEVNLDVFINACYQEGKKIYVPKTDVAQKVMTPYRFEGWDSLKKGVYGIREPLAGQAEQWNGEKFDVILVPGVAFTPVGERLGYGGGFYDRFLGGIEQLPPLFAPCFDMQVVSSLPVEKHDQKVNRIITEKEVYICS